MTIKKTSSDKTNEELFSRNWLFITKETQNKIKNVKVLCCGVGLGSYLAELLIRTGFENLIIADGDVVNLANLNRQAYNHSDLKTNKAKALKKRLLQINPNAKIKMIDKFLIKEDLIKLIPQSDIVVNTIDFDHKSFMECNLLCKQFNKIELFPTNLGFGGSVIVSDKTSKSFTDFFSETDHSLLKIKLVQYLIKDAPEQVKKYFSEYRQSNMPYDPQLGISSFITAALLATTIVKLINGEKINTFPNRIYSDFESLVVESQKTKNE